MRRTLLILPLTVSLFTGCSHLPKFSGHNPEPTASSDAQTRYQQGLAKYRASRFDAALADLDAAIAGKQLSPADTVNARKHMAFILCSSGRELPCREQFQAILKEEPAFNLAPNEAGHPHWGPVWRSLKGAAEQQRVIERASGFMATAAQQKLTEGIKEYENGHYHAALEILQNALKSGFADRSDEIFARKYCAFSYCLTQRTRLCRDEFRKILALDPAFELLPSENRHPSWARSYRLEKAAAVRRAGKR